MRLSHGTGNTAQPISSGYTDRYSFRAVSIGVKYARDSQIVTGYVGFEGKRRRTYTTFFFGVRNASGSSMERAGFGHFLRTQCPIADSSRLASDTFSAAARSFIRSATSRYTPSLN